MYHVFKEHYTWGIVWFISSYTTSSPNCWQLVRLSVNFKRRKYIPFDAHYAIWKIGWVYLWPCGSNWLWPIIKVPWLVKTFLVYISNCWCFQDIYKPLITIPFIVQILGQWNMLCHVSHCLQFFLLIDYNSEIFTLSFCSFFVHICFYFCASLSTIKPRSHLYITIVGNLG